MKKVAFAGKMQVGKTTSADYLVQKYGFVKLSFAGKLKEIAKDLWPEQFAGNEKPRKLLQDLGIKMRELDEAVWARYLVRKVREYSEGTKFAVDDLRFLNEYELLKKEGFFVVRIIRDVPPSPFGNHQSEVEVDKMPYDALIFNTGTFADLYASLDRLVSMA